MDTHRAEVAKIAACVKSFYERGEPFRINHGSTNSTREGALGRDPKQTVDTSQLNRVLSVNVQEMTALVEPNVPMDRLVEATLAHGLIPPVVMEFPGITVGGGYSGTSGESSSFRHGFFNETLNSVEMVLADGEIVTCSKDERAALFHGAAGALGTMGVTTMVELRLREAKRFVETSYYPATSVQEAIEKTKEFTKAETQFDYVDGILFSQSQGAIVVGRLTDNVSEGTHVQTFSKAGDPWFYLHVQDRIRNDPGQTITEAIPLPEYLFRYDRGGFWVGKAPFSYFQGVPFNSFTRWFLDDFLHTRMLYKALHASGQSERMIIQDVALPFDAAAEFVDFTHHRLGIWPLWLCPLKQSPLPTMHPHLNEYEKDGKNLKPMLNIGLWGDASQLAGGFLQANRDLERRLAELKGMKWLYAQTFYTEEEFWRDFDQEWYDQLRRKYRATTLPSVFDKVRAKQSTSKTGSSSLSLLGQLGRTWPIPGFAGIVQAIRSGDYLLARHAAWKDWSSES